MENVVISSHPIIMHLQFVKTAFSLQAWIKVIHNKYNTKQQFALEIVPTPKSPWRSWGIVVLRGYETITGGSKVCPSTVSTLQALVHLCYLHVCV